ncbi:MAG: undecaprenyldiphospho-muramoylpentapeptide beta-N-acetylglucosaminyltransferase [Bryobacterales bacterium]|nr:undecaprenyldiphospho-muramoylpentapeptide beta-N-acetylglucosaminyltransferase [Bryobacteraceae bacterium]MDW8356025.1 undecaprenyldiphospho-muramoylpentapeptide beta-N-acetylglucosaminyltransferase [Bryobacterales bacterium]
MSGGVTFAMAGGGTGGHVMPLLAVAQELRRRGHRPVFIGTRQGLEARLVPAAGFPIEWIEIGGWKRVGLRRALRTLRQLPWSVARVLAIFRRWKPAAVFSLGGYVAAPVMAAALLGRVPYVVMEPNAVPGFASRWFGRFAARALLSFPETAAWFPPGRTELTGVPVREEFFSIPPKPLGEEFVLMISGGSQGSRRLNQAARDSWPLFRESGFAVRFLHQTGPAEYAEVAHAFAGSGLRGEIVSFFEDMAAALAAADLVVCRAGAGALAELAAAGRPAILVPFPYAADDHQRRNAEAAARAGAARVVPDGECTGARLFREVTELASRPDLLEAMGRAARARARPDAARRAATLLEEAAGSRGRVDTANPRSNNSL